MPLKLLSSGGGSVILAANNTVTDFTVSVPPVNGSMVTTGDTGSVKPAMLSTGGPTWDSGSNLTVSGYVSAPYIKTSSNDGSSPLRAASSASAIKALTGTTTDGVYWLKGAASGLAFPAWCIMNRDGGGWVKVLQFNNATSLTTTSAVNGNGTWTTAEINLAPGKIATADWNALKTEESFLFRVSGGSSISNNLLNTDAGTGKLIYHGTLPPWGTDIDPQFGYSLSLDMNSDGGYDYAADYVVDGRGRCNHTTSYWISDHNYSATWMPQAPYNSVAMCWTIGGDRVVTNLHWMSGLSTQSGGDANWGGVSTTAWAIYIR